MIYLIRHGADIGTDRLGGWSNAGLSPLGIEQVKTASDRIVQGDYDIRHVFSSDLPRAKETAEIIAERLDADIVFVQQFRETNNGDLAGILIEQAREKYPGLYWSSLDWEQKYPNGESPKDFFERINDAWASFKTEASSLEGNTLLVTHGGVIDIILCLENGKQYTNKHITHTIGNAEIVSV